MAGSVGSDDPTIGEAPESAGSIGAPGSRVGRYRLIEILGEGGFGVVWRAEQVEPVRREVAVKVIKPGMDSAAVIARFEAERQALAVMDHPCIARVLDGGTTGPEFERPGLPYFVMELVRGEPITAFCDRHRLSVEERLTLFAEVCEAIQHAHMKGVIHRDVKPSNVLVAYDHEGRARPKVIDFGVAKALNQRLTERTLFTERGQLIGTPEYMSPEQAEMGGLDIDTRTDVYSLGVVLYELLTGTLPFDLKRVAQGEVQRLIREIDPPRPSTRLDLVLTRSAKPETASRIIHARRTDARSLSSVLRRDLDWVVMRSLEKNRERRYESAVGLAEDVRRYLAGLPVVAGPPSAGYRVAKFVRRHRIPVAAGVAAAVVLVVATVVSVAFAIVASRARAQTSEALAQREAAFEAEREQRERAKAGEAEAVAARAIAEREAYASAIVACEAAVAGGDYPHASLLLSSTPPSLRGIEYDLLMRALEGAFARLPAHPANAMRVAISPDGRRFASLGVRGELCIGMTEPLAISEIVWNAHDNMLFRNPAFSHDSRNLYTLSGESVVSFDLDGDLDEPRRLPIGFEGLGIAASPTGSLVAVAGINRVAMLDPATGLIVADFELGGRGREVRMLRAAFSPDGRWLVASEYRSVGEWQNLVVVIDPASQQIVSQVEHNVAGVYTLAVSNDRILLDGYGFEAWVCDLPDQTGGVWSGGSAAASADFAPSGIELIIGDDWCIRHGVAGDRSPSALFTHGHFRTQDLDVHASGLIAAATTDGHLLVRRLPWLRPANEPFGPAFRPDQAPDSPFAAEFLSDPNLLAGASRTGMFVWNIDESRVEAEYRLPEETDPKPDEWHWANGRDIRRSPGGSRVAAVWERGVVACWDLATGARLLVHDLQDRLRAGTVEFAAEDLLLVGKSDGSIVEIRIGDGASPERRVLTLGAEITDIDRLSDGRFVASSMAGEIVFFSLDERPERRFRPSDDGIRTIAVNERDGLIAFDRSSRFSDLPIIVIARVENPLEVVRSLRGHRRTISDLEWVLDDEERLISTSYDRTARIWDPRTGRQLLRLDAEWGWDVAVSDDRSRFATSEWTGRITQIYSRSVGHSGLSPESVESARVHAEGRAAFEQAWRDVPRFEAVHRRLTNDPTLAADVRDVALRFVGWYSPDLARIDREAVDLALDESTQASVLEEALARVEAISGRLAATSPRRTGLSSPPILAYRLQRYAEARDVLRTKHQQFVSGEGMQIHLERPWTLDLRDLIVLALCEVRLGDANRAMALDREIAARVEADGFGDDARLAGQLETLLARLRAELEAAR